MMLSSVLLTVACCVLLVGTSYGIDLSSKRTDSSSVKDAYKISNSRALDEFKKLSTKPPRGLSCTRGPYKRDYYKPGYLFYPPVKVGLCDDLYCRYPGKCIPTKTYDKYQWVVIYKCTKRYCIFHGIRFWKFTHHQSCKCAECTRDSHCRRPKKCNRYTWTCECPATGYCPKGYTWDRYKCKCVKKY